MCKSHWTEYTRALRKASAVSKAEVVEPAPEPPRRSRRFKAAPEPEVVAG